MHNFVALGCALLGYIIETLGLLFLMTPSAGCAIITAPDLGPPHPTLMSNSMADG
jgi:hypothetical protein